MHSRSERKSWHTVVAVFACCFGVGVAGLFVTSETRAASIPAWLDDAITNWNDANPQTPMSFVDIKDSYVWYMIPQTEEIGHQDIRESVYGLVMEHAYKVADDEERVTTGKPPSPIAPYKDKKCWSRSFVRNIHALDGDTPTGSRGGRAGGGQKQRMLTSLVCDDRPYWFAGFRTLD